LLLPEDTAESKRFYPTGDLHSHSLGLIVSVIDSPNKPAACC
jgi:hypothetical protein